MTRLQEMSSTLMREIVLWLADVEMDGRAVWAEAEGWLEEQQ